MRPTRLLTQNRQLRRIGVWNWTLPAFVVTLDDGRTVNVCPSAGICAQVCYARNGTYLFRNVRARHLANLAYVLDDLDGWREQMTAELRHPRHRGGWVRIHDAGDYLSDAYLEAWLAIMRATPDTKFYAYTKEISRHKRIVEPHPLANYTAIYSYGGREDALIDPDCDRLVDVFPTASAVDAAGHANQCDADTLAATGPRLVGIAANNIPAARRRQGDRTFRGWQAEVDTRRAARKCR